MKMMKMPFAALGAFWFLLLVINGPEGVESAVADKDTLVLVHVLFRHGNRTANGPEELYPKDPYLNETYFPVGLGQLTNVGKRREYAIGKALRERYSVFLGPYYYPEIVEAQSTDYNRTKASLLLVLASLFPPRGIETWYPFLNWQPVPYNYLPQNKDEILLGTICPNYLRLYNEYIRTPTVQDNFNQYKNITDYISNNTGLNITKFQDVYNLFFGLATEEEWPLKLPPWTKKVWPKAIVEMAIQEYFVSTGTTDLNRMAVGYFLRKILADTNSKINGSNPGRKMYLYSAHELNIAQLLIVLGIFNPPHIPTYGSYVILEVHKVQNNYEIRIYYENYTTYKPQLLKLPACDRFCTINQFASLVQEYIPSDNLCNQ